MRWRDSTEREGRGVSGTGAYVAIHLQCKNNLYNFLGQALRQAVTRCRGRPRPYHRPQRISVQRGYRRSNLMITESRVTGAPRSVRRSFRPSSGEGGTSRSSPLMVMKRADVPSRVSVTASSP